MYPLVCGEVLLPQFHLNLPQYFHMGSDSVVQALRGVAQQMLPTHVFVKVSTVTKKTFLEKGNPYFFSRDFSKPSGITTVFLKF